jgi:hypothetical protein
VIVESLIEMIPSPENEKNAPRLVPPWRNLR